MSTYWPSAANQCGLCQDFFHRQFHERLPQMERERHQGQDVGKLQGALRRNSPPAQAYTGGGSAANSGYHAANAAVGQAEDQMAE
jgi:hypothetical protein